MHLCLLVGRHLSFHIPHSRKNRSTGLEYWLRKDQKLQQSKNFKPLTVEQVQGVEKFVFFTGYPRSGHSIVGSFLDAHPNIVLSYAFFLFRNLLKESEEDGNMDDLLRNKTLFFNILYEKSYRYSLASSKKMKKGYSLDVPGLWSGKFDGHLRVIGDKSALPTSMGYSNSLPGYFKQRYDSLQSSLGIPLLGIHVVRNPFDMISTHLLYSSLHFAWKSDDWSPTNVLRNDSGLRRMIEFFFDKAQAVQEMVPECGMKVLEVHNEDIVKNPRRELRRLCNFLGVDCPEQYLQKCESKSFKKVSRTRDKVYWPPHLRQLVEERMRKYSFFRGYSFEEDYYNPV